MIKITVSEDSSFYRIELVGKLCQADYEEIQNYFKPIIATNQTLKMMIDQTQFEGVTKLELIKTHIETLKMISAHTVKVASIGNKFIQRVLPTIVNQVIKTNIRFFYQDNIKLAHHWLES